MQSQSLKILSNSTDIKLPILRQVTQQVRLSSSKTFDGSQIVRSSFILLPLQANIDK